MIAGRNAIIMAAFLCIYTQNSDFRAGMESIDGCLKNAYLPDLYVLQLCIYEQICIIVHVYMCICISSISLLTDGICDVERTLSQRTPKSVYLIRLLR